MILYEVLNERPDVLAERTYAVWPDLEALMREHGVPQFTVDAHRPVGASTCSASRFSTELGYTNMLTALDLAGIPLRRRGPRRRPPDRPRRRARRVQPRADRRLHRRRRRSATARRPCSRSPTIVRDWKARGPPRRPRRAAAAPGPHRRASTCRAFYDVDYLPDGRIQRVVPNRPGVPLRVSQAHRHGPRRAGRTRSSRWCRSPRPCTSGYRVEIFRGCTRGCRFCQAGMITRPVRERSHHRHRRDGRAGPGGHRLRGGRPALAVLAPTTPRSATSPRASPTGTRAQHRRCRCRRPASTRSTSTWPTSCPATAAAPA